MSRIQLKCRPGVVLEDWAMSLWIQVLFMLCEPKGGEEKMDEILPDVVVDSLRTSLEIPMLGLDEVPSCVDETL